MSPTPAPAARAGEELPSTEVVVVRHGDDRVERLPRRPGPNGPELNEAGRRQAVVVVLTEALRERHMGYLQGLRWDDAVDKSPDSLHIVKVIEGSDPGSRNQELPGGGESLNQLNERCVCFLNKIAQDTPGSGWWWSPTAQRYWSSAGTPTAGQLRPKARPQHLAQRLPRLRRHRAVGAREVRDVGHLKGDGDGGQLPGGLVRGRRGLGVNPFAVAPCMAFDKTAVSLRNCLQTA
ncbi:hypothetical protein Zm00014a_012136 [Zea mays]|uniref:Uncharacterized protein n=1 Tax=Zea mays TaxID=4577 RepID=A0A3L6F830_MAIZE|nr:hypothetical protein Zm00014a_012136 [Zea mays]